MQITIPYDVYVIAMAALLECDHHEQVCGGATLRWTDARRQLKAAMLREVTREMDESVPMLCRKQAG